jgi:lysophospholipase L1-like esterase
MELANRLKGAAALATTVLGFALAAHAYLQAGGGRVRFTLGLALAALGLVALAFLGARRGASARVRVLKLAASLVIAVPIVDAVWDLVEPSSTATVPLEHVYSFEAARGDPAAYRRWRERYLREWRRVRDDYLMEDPRGVNPRVPIPGSVSRFLDSERRINALGFRGPEIARAKGHHYRIVALGESTTFGATIRAGERPWPEVLEERIAAQLVCDAPVQVVNAGVPGWTLANNLARLRSDILPLDPDLLVSYHGYNGFPYLLSALPPVAVSAAPQVPERPSRLLRQVEAALRYGWFRRRYRAARAIDERALDVELQMTRYADLYRQLAAAAREAGVPLVLASFDMAVNASTPDEVVRFYEPAFPDLRARLLANRLHNRLVVEIAALEGIPAIDTSADLDGAWRDAYIDPIHFTQLGRDRLARNVLAGIRPILREANGCRPRAGETPPGN